MRVIGVCKIWQFAVKSAYFSSIIKIKKRRMRVVVMMVCLFGFLALGAAQTNYVGSVGVSPRLTALANFYLNTLTTQIITYNWINCNRQSLFTSISKASEYLHHIKVQLGENNVVDGSNNQIYGRKNVVIGGKNKVIGVNNWIFVSEYSTGSVKNTIDEGVLVIANYRIDLCKINLLTIDPTLVISKLNRNDMDAFLAQNAALSYFFS